MSWVKGMAERRENGTEAQGDGRHGCSALRLAENEGFAMARGPKTTVRPRPRKRAKSQRVERHRTDRKSTRLNSSHGTLPNFHVSRGGTTGGSRALPRARFRGLGRKSVFGPFAMANPSFSAQTKGRTALPLVALRLLPFSLRSTVPFNRALRSSLGVFPHAWT